MASRWREWLGQDESAEADFVAWIEARVALAQRQMEEATSWEAVLEARGQKKSLDAVLTFVNIGKQEDRSYARFRAPSHVKPA